MEFTDAIREGDGLRVMRCWRFFLPLFKCSKRKNYSTEACNIIMFYPHDKPNSSCGHDLLTPMDGLATTYLVTCTCMEHVNRACKTAMSSVGANITVQTLDHVGKCIGSLMKVMSRFDGETDVKEFGGSHSQPKSERDIATIVKQLVEVKLFQPRSGPQTYPSFNKLPRSIYMNLKYEALFQWMKQTVRKKFPVQH